MRNLYDPFIVFLLSFRHAYENSLALKVYILTAHTVSLNLLFPRRKKIEKYLLLSASQ